jgi:hypothetical protein
MLLKINYRNRRIIVIAKDSLKTEFDYV